jgi:hypothetical protein
MRTRTCKLLVRLLAEVDQEIAALEDPLVEPVGSDEVQRAVAALFELHRLRDKLEDADRANEL